MTNKTDADDSNKSADDLSAAQWLRDNKDAIAGYNALEVQSRLLQDMATRVVLPMRNYPAMRPNPSQSSTQFCKSTALTTSSLPSKSV
jgi:hypothetical protein